MTVKDLVSIIIPAYNAAAFINDAIESALAQDYRPIEVIVVDDGSSDETASIAERFGPPVICHRQQNGGPPVRAIGVFCWLAANILGFWTPMICMSQVA
jgi:Glycosyltransferases involved in cell wall biogenesis